MKNLGFFLLGFVFGIISSAWFAVELFYYILGAEA